MSNRSIKWIMIVCGVLTCTMVYAVIAPHAMLQSTFGETLEGPLAYLIVRNWGALILLVGAMLIYGGFHPERWFSSWPQQYDEALNYIAQCRKTMAEIYRSFPVVIT